MLDGQNVESYFHAFIIICQLNCCVKFICEFKELIECKENTLLNLCDHIQSSKFDSSKFKPHTFLFSSEIRLVQSPWAGTNGKR